ncbi:hypothetical protein Q3G72_020589 [Acer saccharum]|nr:hypothetical protein Q3G72_020589 [Acer saccharum]
MYSECSSVKGSQVAANISTIIIKPKGMGKVLEFLDKEKCLGKECVSKVVDKVDVSIEKGGGKWRMAARKKYGAKGMVGVFSPIKRIIEARQAIKKKNYCCPSLLGKGQLGGESKLISPIKK